MKISRSWLQKFFDIELPKAGALAEALTFHAFEIEGVENEILDVKVTANRGHDCLSHLGIAKELSAILNVPLKMDPLRQTISLPPTDNVSVQIATPLCARYIAGVIHGVKVGPSPEWLQKDLESIGQKSINNVVDATNYIMFGLGQPLHAFDAKKLSNSSKIGVRAARDGEKMLALDEKEYALRPSDLVIVDGNDTVIGIAGVKGGKPSGVDANTSDIILESANFDGISVRRTAAALKLRTDASSRFEQVLSPELPEYGIRAATDLIVQLAGGEIAGFVDSYQKPQEKRAVTITLAKIHSVLGTSLRAEEVSDVFKRLDLPFNYEGYAFIVEPPFERLDLLIPEDLIEEVGRIVGYEKVPSVALPAWSAEVKQNENFAKAETIREHLMQKGYSEVFTSVFTEKGEKEVKNKVGGERPFLRTDILTGLNDALQRNARNKDLLGLAQVRLFEIGTIWKDGKEEIHIGSVAEKGAPEEGLLSDIKPEPIDALPLSTTERYQTFSKYPFIVRDIALWVPKGTEPVEVLSIIREKAGDLLVRSALFDRFEKGDKLSLAFRLIFQSFEKTLTDTEVGAIMEKITAALEEKAYEIR